MYKLLQLLILGLACRGNYGLQCFCFETNVQAVCSQDPMNSCNTDYMCYAQCFIEGGEQQMRFGCALSPADAGLPDGLAQCSSNVTGSLNTECCNSGTNCNEFVRLSCLNEPTTTTVPFTETTTDAGTSGNTQSHLPVVIALPIASVLLLAMFLTGVAGGVVVYLRRRKLRQRSTDLAMNSMYHSDPCEPNGMLQYEPTMDISEFGATSGSGAGKTRLIQSTISRQIKLGELIGSGRYGQVHVGHYQGDKIAVKKFFSKDERSWFREIEIYTSVLLRHDNILGFVAGDIASNNGVTELWLITQFHHHGSLYDYLNREELSLKSLLQMAIALCSGLTHLHTEIFGTQSKPAIAHRDMKSKNVLVKNSHSVCIADFGLAVLNNSHMNGINMPTNPKQGTKRYMAPEILDETIVLSKFDSFKKVDIYATGLVLWEMSKRCSRPPPHSAGEYEVPYQGLVPPDPSFEEMKRCVVVERRQPTIPAWWGQDDLLQELSLIMVECWHINSLTRPSAIYLKKKLKRIAEECKMDSDSSE